MKSVISHTIAIVVGASVVLVLRKETSPDSLGTEAESSMKRKQNTLVLAGTLREMPSKRIGELRVAEGKSGTDAMHAALMIQDNVTRMTAIQEAAMLLAAEGIEGFEVIDMIPNLLLKRVAADTFFQVLAQTSPELALVKMKETKMPSDFPCWTAAIQSLLSKDPNAAGHEAATTSPGPLRDRLVSTVASEWASINPTGALSWAESLPTSFERNQTSLAIIEAVSTSNPSNAAKLALKLEPGKSRDKALSMVASSKVADNPDDAFAWIHSLPQEDQRKAVEGAIDGLASVDPGKAAELIQNLDSSPIKRNLTIKVLGEMALDDWKAASRWLNDVGGTSNPELAAPVLWVMSQQAPEEAAKLLEQLPFSSSISDHVGEIAASYMDASGGETALRWARAIPDIKMKEEAIKDVFTAWAKRDPDTALQMATDPTSKSAVLAVLAKTQPDGLVEDFRKQQPSAGSGFAYVDSLANEEPKAALEILRLMNGKDAESAADLLAEKWGAADPATAAKASMNLPVSIGDSFRSTVIAAWVNDDPVAASSWIGSLPNGRTRDKAIASMVAAVEESDPERAAEWVNEISDPEVRQSVSN